MKKITTGSGEKISGLMCVVILTLILAFAWITRVVRLGEPPVYYFDEVYHAFTAEAYSRNDPRGYEWWHKAPEGVAYEWLHPPISKLLMGASIRILGHNSFAWRLPSAIFGVLTIASVFWFTRTLWKKDSLALLAAFLVSLDGLLLAQSRIAMNDIFLVGFVLLALGWYWRWREEEFRFQNSESSKKPYKFNSKRLIFLLLAGIFSGLAVATKWSGVFVMGIVGVWEVVSAGFEIGRRWIANKNNDGSWTRLFFEYVKRAGLLLIVFGLLPVLIYLLSYGQWWLQGHTWAQFKELHNQIWWYETHLEATHPYQSKPWQWVLNLKPVWFHVDYSQENKLRNIYALANPVIAYGGILGMVWLLFYSVANLKKEGLFVLLAYLMFWVPWVFSPRIMFFYHYAPAIPFLGIALAHLCWSWWKSGYRVMMGVAVLTVLLTVVGFGYFYPHWTGLPMPKDWVEQYYWFESWR